MKAHEREREKEKRVEAQSERLSMTENASYHFWFKTMARGMMKHKVKLRKQQNFRQMTGLFIAYQDLGVTKLMSCFHVKLFGRCHE